MSIMPSIHPSDFVAKMRAAAGIPYPQTKPAAVVGAMGPNRTADMQVVGATQTSVGDWVKRIVTGVWEASPIGISSKVMIPIAKGVEKAGAGTQAALAGVGTGAANFGEGLRSGVEDVARYAKIGVLIAIVLGAVYLYALVAQPLMLARSAK